MRDGKSFVSGTLRWLGAAADFAAGVFGGTPIGITTDITNAPRPSGESSCTEKASEEEGDSAN